MNVTDIKDISKTPDNIWKEIFNKQWELALKYSEIEEMGNLLQTLETNIDTAFGQAFIKDFAWRTTEELAEATEAYQSIKTDDLDVYYLEEHFAETEHSMHYLEELIDALHFLTELTLIAGFNYEIVKAYESPSKGPSTPWDIVYNLGLMCNCLKNKPWKQTQMLTDRVKFEQYLKISWAHLVRILFQNNLTTKDIYNLYFKKQEVNKFRIRSKY